MVHFSQAHGTPFTVEPLSKLDWNASCSEAENLLHGQIPPEITVSNQFAMDILKHIAKRIPLPEIDTYLSPDDGAKGFRCWKETTSTSPSGCHLGLQRIPTLRSTDEESEKNPERHSGNTNSYNQHPTDTGFLAHAMANGHCNA
jgi:hypothetical protein